MWEIPAEAIAAGHDEHGWYPIETAPKDGRYLWVGSAGSMRVAVWAAGKQWEYRGSVGGGWRDHCGAETRGLSDLHFTPTHWQPVPGPVVKPETPNEEN